MFRSVDAARASRSRRSAAVFGAVAHAAKTANTRAPIAVMLSARLRRGLGKVRENVEGTPIFVVVSILVMVGPFLYALSAATGPGPRQDVTRRRQQLTARFPRNDRLQRSRERRRRDLRKRCRRYEVAAVTRDRRSRAVRSPTRARPRPPQSCRHRRADLVRSALGRTCDRRRRFRGSARGPLADESATGPLADEDATADSSAEAPAVVCPRSRIKLGSARR